MAGILAQQMRRAGGAPTSPNLIVNPNGDDGIVGWDAELGTAFTTRVGDVDAGQHNFFFGNTGSLALKTLRQRQIVNVPTEYQSMMGQGTINFSFDYRTTTKTVVDYGIATLRCHSGVDGSGDVLAIIWSDDLKSAGAKASYTLAVPAPLGTRSITVAISCRQLDGLNADFYFRNVSVTISPSAGQCVPIFAWNIPAELGWTVTAGNITGSTTTSTTSEFSGIFAVPSAWGGSQANLAYHRDIVLTPAALALVASSNAVARLNLINWRNNSSDKSRSYVQFLGAGDVVLGAVEDAATPRPWLQSPTRQRHNASVPMGTVKFRVGHQFARSDGTVDDAIVAQFSATLEVLP